MSFLLPSCAAGSSIAWISETVWSAGCSSQDPLWRSLACARAAPYCTVKWLEGLSPTIPSMLPNGSKVNGRDSHRTTLPSPPTLPGDNPALPPTLPRDNPAPPPHYLETTLPPPPTLPRDNPALPLTLPRDNPALPSTLPGDNPAPPPHYLETTLPSAPHYLETTLPSPLTLPGDNPALPPHTT